MSIGALVRTSHPGPSAAVTILIMALVVRAAPHGTGPAAALPAVLAGELGIGWSNDYFDAERDAAAGRTDKPLVTGEIGPRAVLVAALTALAASLALAFSISPLTGAVNAVMMAAGWAYNARLKVTAASGLAYVVGFGLIPAFAASTAPGHPSARPWTLAAAALLGLGGHFTDVLPDLAGDETAGVRGLPQRVAERYGPTAVRATAFTLLLGASALITFAGGPGSGSASDWVRRAGFAAAVLLTAVGAGASGRIPFLAAIGIAGINAASFIFGGVTLT